MDEKIKNIFSSTSMTWRNGSYSVGLIVLVIAIAVIINMIAGQLPENIRKIAVTKFLLSSSSSVLFQYSTHV